MHELQSSLYPYHEPELDRLSISEYSDYSNTLELLTDERTLEEARSGNLTLAMIRPQVGPDSNLLGLSDIECAERIEEMIEGLGVAAKFSLRFPEEVIDTFYGGSPQQTMERAEPEDPSRYDSRWPEFKVFMSSGPTTILFLHSPEGGAVEKWRAHLGHWNIDKFRDPATIRGRLGVNLFNNLVHGSDSPESVVRELGLIAEALRSVQG